MSLLMDQSRSVSPLRSAKAREFGELWWEKRTLAPGTNWQMESDLRWYCFVVQQRLLT